MSDEFEPRRAKPGEVFSTTDGEGREFRVRADDGGVVRPKNEREKALLDAHGLPVARKAIEEEKEASEKSRPRRSAD